METNKKKRIIIGSIILIALIAVFAIAYAFNKPAVQEGGKQITIEVTGSDATTDGYTFSTDAEYLIQAMDELAETNSDFTYSGSDSEYGMMIEVINGERAVYAEDGAYWALYVNGEYGQYGADSQPVEDGAKYTWTYEKAQ